MTGGAAVEVRSRPEYPRLLPSALLGEAAGGGSRRRSVRDWVVDVGCFVLALGGGLVLWGDAADVARNQPSGWLVAADLLAGVAACLALWWRRRWPVHLAVVMALVAGFSAMSGFATSIALFTVAVHRRASVLAAVAALHLVAGIAYGWVRPDPELPPWVNLLMTVLFVVAIVGFGMFVRARRQLVLSLRERARRAESEQQLRVQQARQLERTRIAREMHDVLAHRISLVSVHAGALEFHADAAPHEVAASAAVIRESAHQALQDLREILGVLRAEVAQEDLERPQPTIADVPRLIEESRRAGMRVSSVVPAGDHGTAPVSIGRTAYRVVQEGLTNARKHAPGAEVTVRLSGGAGAGLTVEVTSRPSVRPAEEPGADGTEIPGAGVGLAGLAERVALAGGRLENGLTPSGDFRLRAWLPWPP